MGRYHSAPYEMLRRTPLSGLRILVSNDDGIHAPGMQILEKVARAISDDVWVVAPEREQSAAAHSLTIHQPLRMEEVSERHYAVSGTPTDAVLLATKVVLAGQKQPDLILSGVNRGGNLGEDITYSGTIAAAMEGTLLEIPSIAFSQCFHAPTDIHWDTAEAWAEKVVRAVCASEWAPNTLMNVNFPPIEASTVKGVKAAPHGRRKIGDKLTRHVDPKGRPYYWIGADRWDRADWPGCDIDAINDGFISVTPIGMDLTDYKALEGIHTHLDSVRPSSS